MEGQPRAAAVGGNRQRRARMSCAAPAQLTTRRPIDPRPACRTRRRAAPARARRARTTPRPATACCTSIQSRSRRSSDTPRTPGPYSPRTRTPPAPVTTMPRIGRPARSMPSPQSRAAAGCRARPGSACRRTACRAGTWRDRAGARAPRRARAAAPRSSRQDRRRRSGSSSRMPGVTADIGGRSRVPQHERAVLRAEPQAVAERRFGLGRAARSAG